MKFSLNVEIHSLCVKNGQKSFDLNLYALVYRIFCKLYVHEYIHVRCIYKATRSYKLRIIKYGSSLTYVIFYEDMSMLLPFGIRY